MHCYCHSNANISAWIVGVEYDIDNKDSNNYDNYNDNDIYNYNCNESCDYNDKTILMIKIQSKLR